MQLVDDEPEPEGVKIILQLPVGFRVVPLNDLHHALRLIEGAFAELLDRLAYEPGRNNKLRLMTDYFRSKKMSFKPVVINDLAAVQQAFFGGRCDVFTTDISGLASTRQKADKPDDYQILPEAISKEPLGPMVRHGDDQWFDIVKWTLFALITAEELGITQKNVDEMAKSTKPEMKRVFGTDGNLGEQLGLTKDWVSRIVKAVGNYGETFDRNVGAGSKLGIARGINALWNKGGIQYAPPIR